MQVVIVRERIRDKGFLQGWPLIAVIAHNTIALVTTSKGRGQVYGRGIKLRKLRILRKTEFSHQDPYQYEKTLFHENDSLIYQSTLLINQNT